MSSSEQALQPEQLADKLSEKQREILLVFWGENGEANTHDITTSTGYDNRIVANHTKGKLREYGLLEQDGVDESVTVGPRHPNNYVTTPLGEDVIEVYRQRKAKTEADISRVDELAETVERLETENERLRERFEKLKEYVSTNVS